MRIKAENGERFRAARRVAYSWLWGLAVMLCVVSAHAQDEPHRAATDKIPPEITHQPYTQAVIAGDPITVKAEASDPSGIRLVRLWYRTDALGEFRVIPMQRNDHGPYEARIDLTTEEISTRKVEYYFDATDQANNVATLGAALLPFAVMIEVPKVAAGRREFNWKWILGAIAVAGLACATETGICESPDPSDLSGPSGPSGQPIATIVNAPVPGL